MTKVTSAIQQAGYSIPIINKVQGDKEMLWTIIGVLVVLWLIGFIGHIGGGLIHILLIIAAIVLVYNLIAGRRSAV